MAGEEQDLIKRAYAFIDAFNAGDWQRFAVDLAPDLVYEETGTQRRTESVDAYVQLSQGWKQAFPNARGDVRNVVASGDTVVQEVAWEGTQTGTLEGPSGPLPPSGRRVRVLASLWITFTGGSGEGDPSPPGRARHARAAGGTSGHLTANPGEHPGQARSGDQAGKERPMPLYVALGSWTDQGTRDFGDAVQRANGFREMVEQAGDRGRERARQDHAGL